MKKLYGVVAPSFAPILPSGEIDEVSMRKLCRYLIDVGMHGLYPNGTNGESLLLSEAERKRVAEIYQEENQGAASLFIQCGALRPEETVSLVRHAHEIGADGVGVMTPVFFPCDQAAMEIYCREALEAAEGMPVYLYNIPIFACNDISPALFGKLMDRYPNLLGIKFSSSNLMRVEDYLRATERHADLLIGCDSMFLPCLAAGGVGTVSGPAQVFPKYFTALYDAWLAGDMERAVEMQKCIVEMDRIMEGIPQIPAVKAILKMMGVFAHDNCRKPFRPLTKEEYGKLERILDTYQKDIARRF